MSSRKEGKKTIKVFDMVFSKMRILKQVTYGLYKFRHFYKHMHNI